MKKITLFILAPLVLLLAVALARPEPDKNLTQYELKLNNETVTEANHISYPDQAATSTQLITYARTLLGTPYTYAGITPRSGFDCSGFVTHVFGTKGIKVPHSSGMQSKEGKAITRSQAAPGDIIIFTGTNRSIRKPGHTGIVISAPGDTITFIHSSSNGGVKISKVEGTGYEARFLGIRRIL